ncbi:MULTISPECIES: fatty acid oxidation complex subunit alpha FadJ [unclassified Shewanella]|uniref:fatty acid oxidation complex subunit alpha FadJ n=1 Tax=unclassified Shewanella TaxID=196818 RepID=UPI002002A656|nr:MULTISPECIES: fatty acid oxidation complex subunit alpha FadJ [unclassified Shewanella]MCK7636209.1 fatty acid oxidation complex subunit alpha FadJ [Shewanella sp. JNE17]MCK7651364.1 fatty acid oxidation complex subunit alpha FadJ [Shewanella sp. JNE8]MCK7659621.1 fatty acid oxidation complex subunit alpha FadJ [Shewanella sp. JNE4-2]UPO29842.1 fatty acid oxidation complex subunit alpha FadJ [Shewanella sp. JNE2]
MEKTFNLTRRDDGIAILTMDVPGETMNTLKAQFGPEISEILAEIKSDPHIRGLVLISGKKDSFVAGADISMLDACKTVGDAKALSQQGHVVFNELEALKIPVVAAIHGACLGGGLELALACHQRVCSDDGKTMLGVPEVQLGLLPGGGGTQRLPRLVGITTALDMMLTGKQIRPKQALKMGLVNDVVPQTILLQTAVEMALAGKRAPKPIKKSLVNQVLEGTSFGRNIIFDQASKQVEKKTQGNYPAPAKIIDCVRQGIAKGMQKGLEVEASHFAELVVSKESEALRSIFFATTEMKKETGAEGATPRKVNKAVILGGGLMGGGIASVTTTKAKIPVRVKDISEKGLSNALSYAYKLLDKGVKRRHMTPAARDNLMALMTTTTEYKGVKDADIVVEAVFEDLALKHQMVKDIERECGEHTIFASNTSSLPISQIAEASTRPENVIGLHYFSPVEKMPLVEVIAHAKTSPETIATTVAFARKQGKTPIVVQDGAGFYVNRILALYMNEAAQLLLEGQSVEHLDKALVKFGFPVGPITLLDEVGIDVGAKISPILEKELGERFKAPAAFGKLLGDDRKGRKNGKGFYQYGASSKKTKAVDETVYGVLGIKPGTNKDAKALAERCVVQMLNEAVRCLDDGIIASPRDGDIGAIFGIGFPPFLGGPFHYIDTLGAANLVKILEGYQSQFGNRFEPCERLKTMARENVSFF